MNAKNSIAPELGSIRDYFAARHANPLVGWRPWSSVGLTFFAELIAPQLLIIIGILLVRSITGQEASGYLQDKNPLTLFLLKAFSGIVSVSLVYAYVRSRGGWQALGITTFRMKALIKTIFAYMSYVSASALVFYLLYVHAPWFDIDQAQDVGVAELGGRLDTILTFGSLVVLAPLLEEVVFRGFLFQGIARRTGFWGAALGSSAVFGLFHGQWNVAVDTFILGIAACWLVWSTRSVWPAILLHMLKNGIAFWVFFYA